MCPLACTGRTIAALLDLSMSFSIISGIKVLSNAVVDLDGSLLSLFTLGGGGLASLGGCCGLGSTSDLLSDSEGSLFSVEHNLEALEVGEVGTSVSLGQLLHEGGLLPGLLQTSGLRGLNQSACAGTTVHLNNRPGEGQSLEGQDRSGEVLAVDEHAVHVGDVHNSHLSAVVLSEVNVCNSAWFHEVFVSLHKARKTG